MTGIDGGRKTGGPGEKPSKQGRERTNKLNSHEVPHPGIEPGTTAERATLAALAPDSSYKIDR